MSAIVVARVQVTDPEKYETYKPLAKAAIEAHGGRYLVRGAEPVVLEGETAPVRYVVVEFDSVETVQKFYDSPLYLKAREARDGAAIAQITALQSV
ncbi:DUF1330 domain-containing protein [Pseudohoeflea coraliihabitans]|uniref:DUF1330 domain-containing protein n=1 Tax=Pseudohoeflea coraliihabitans TaxID=2860393 RepID=A0ABS6WS00_9HYPH|nr:DUF1330 domain-containing protein [Pseudohoeflea sp. DP4N28-3]MBW3098433.1 DUF1330 domain-containing protein [Pseudohoeflea sp. DP4N28-3]